MSTQYVITKDGKLLEIDDELYHYGVLGMKWGVRKAAYKSAANERLARKAYAYDKKSAVLNKKAEKRHAIEDLERSNTAANKAAKYRKKAAAISKKALKTESERKRLSMERKAENLKYKAAKKQTKANRLSKTIGYSAKAMEYSIKSDKVAVKAARARAEIASNKAYIASMNRKLSSLSKEELRKVETPLTQIMTEALRSSKKKS